MSSKLLVMVLLSLGSPTIAQAQFRFDESIEPRDFEYNDEYYISVLSFSPRLTHRWLFRRAAVGYSLAIGSLKNNEFYIDQRVRLRAPFSDELSGEYRLIQAEDYDSRYVRNQVEVALRGFRPAGSQPLSETLGFTPPPDGLFLGGTAELEASKEFIDAGIFTGYANHDTGARLDVIRPDLVFNGKNREKGEYTDIPLAIRGSFRATVPGGALRLLAWGQEEIPLRMTLPERNGLVFRYQRVSAGLAALWQPTRRFRLDLDLQGEMTRKRWRYESGGLPRKILRRRGFLGTTQFEVDLEPIWGSTASRGDVFYGGLLGHHLDESTRVANAPNVVLRRSEIYAELGYVLGVPTPFDSWQLGLRAAGQLGVLSQRDVRPLQHTVGQILLAKAGLGIEGTFREGLASFFLHLTFRLDDPSFGGGNVQVLLRF